MRDLLSSCTGKAGHTTRAAAEKSIEGIRKRPYKKGAPRRGKIEAYKCDCGLYHVGHKGMPR